MIILAVICYALLAIYEFVPLYKQKLWKDFSLNIVLWILSFTMAVLLCFNVRIPSPAPLIRDTVTSIFGK